MLPLTGQVGIVTHGTTFWPRLIERVTNSAAHHVVVATSETMCVGAQPGGARYRPITDFQNIIWSRFHLTETQRTLIGFYSRSLINQPYNYAAFLLIGAQLATGTSIPAWVQRAVSTTRRMECAQLADTVLTAAGVQVFDDGREPGIVYPGSWEQLFTRKGWITNQLTTTFVA